MVEQNQEKRTDMGPNLEIHRRRERYLGVLEDGRIRNARRIHWVGEIIDGLSGNHVLWIDTQALKCPPLVR